MCVDTHTTHQRVIQHPMLEPRDELVMYATVVVEFQVSALTIVTAEQNGMYLCDDMRLAIDNIAGVASLAVVDIKCRRPAHSHASLCVKTGVPMEGLALILMYVHVCLAGQDQTVKMMSTNVPQKMLAAQTTARILLAHSTVSVGSMLPWILMDSHVLVPVLDSYRMMQQLLVMTSTNVPQTMLAVIMTATTLLVVTLVTATKVMKFMRTSTSVYQFVLEVVKIMELVYCQRRVFVYQDGLDSIVKQILMNVQKAQVVASKYVPIQKVAMSARAMLDTCWNPMATLVKILMNVLLAMVDVIITVLIQLGAFTAHVDQGTICMRMVSPV